MKEGGLQTRMKTGRIAIVSDGTKIRPRTNSNWSRSHPRQFAKEGELTREVIVDVLLGGNRDAVAFRGNEMRDLKCLDDPGIDSGRKALQ
jgi:hypothetical protein